MAFDSMTDSRAGASGLMLTNTNTSPFQRTIPSFYNDDERWTLETSGWTKGSYDMSLEDELDIMLSDVLLSMPAQAASDLGLESMVVDEEAQISVGDAVSTFDNSLDLEGIFQPVKLEPDQPATVSPAQLLLQSGAQVNLQNASCVPQSPFTNAVPNIPYVPTMNSVTQTYTPSSTPPALSPPSSISSLDDSDFELDLHYVAPQTTASSRLQVPERCITNVPYVPQLQYGMNQFVQQFAPVGSTFAPATYYPSALSSNQTVAPSPSISPLYNILGVNDAASNNMSTYSMAQMSAAPSMKVSSSKTPRKSMTRSRRAHKTYARSVTFTPKTESSDLSCPICNYVQTRGPGDVRSFNRHCETHPELKKYEWRCRGIMRMCPFTVPFQLGSNKLCG